MKAEDTQPPKEGHIATPDQGADSLSWHGEVLRSRAEELLDRDKWLTIDEVRLALARDQAEIYRIVKEREHQPTASMDEALKRLGLSQDDL
jgi:hypothetical protein